MYTERLQKDGCRLRIKAAETTFFSGGLSSSRKMLRPFYPIYS